MADPYLTVIIVNDPEKDPKLLEYCFQAIRDLNADAIPDIQFIVLNQDPDGAAAYELAQEQPFDVEWVDAGYECVGGVVLWDLMASLKALWPKLRGEYHILMHKEWVAGPGTLKKSIEWLKANGEPPVAVANLRRVGTKKQLAASYMASSGKRTSDRLRAILDTGDTTAITSALHRARTMQWKHWLDPAKRKPGIWVEDAYFGRNDWFEEIKFFDIADRQLFQDVYDLLAIVFKKLQVLKRAPDVPQIPLSCGAFYHLWHSKGYLHFSDRVIEYLCGDPDRWAGTQFAQRNTLERLRDFVSDPNATHRTPLIDFRQAQGGTAERFREGLERHFRSGQKTPTPQKQGRATPPREIQRIAVIGNNRRYGDLKEPHRHLVTGLAKLGLTATYIKRVPPQRSWPPWSGGTPDAMVIWNGQNGGWLQKVKDLREEGMSVFAMERGFFDRFNYTQIDHAGFGHSASWAKNLTRAAPTGAAKRFRAVWGADPVDMAARKDGYVLILLQVLGDAQLLKATPREPGPLVKSVLYGLNKVAKRADIPVRVRAHPQFAWNCGTNTKARMIEGTLKDAVAGARFCVTINSNAANEALAWGCPVMAFGPAMFLDARVALRTSVGATSNPTRKMLGGWAPAKSEVRNYLYHLACRQWSTAELAQGSALRGVLDAAMV